MAGRMCNLGAFCLALSLTFFADGFSAFHRSNNVCFAATRCRRRIHPMQLSKQSQEIVHSDTMVQKQPVVTARYVAAHALMGENKKTQPSLQRLENDILFQTLQDQRNRSFARLLVATVERRLGQIDKVLKQCQTTNRSKQQNNRARRHDLYVEACLRMGVAQLLFLDVSPHAAVKETIDVLRQDDRINVPESKIKYANAVLRRITREGDAMLSDTSATDNIAPWLVESWKQSWGQEVAVAIAESFMQQSSIDLSVNYEPGTTTNKERLEQQQEIQSAFGGGTDILPNGSIRMGKNITGAVTDWPLYKEGKWWVQDVSASLPAIALHNALTCNSETGNEVGNMHVIDVCAAPGGKTAQLVSLGFGQVTAVELSARRSQRLVENLERLNLQDKCNVCIADGSEWVPENNERIAGVLVDVPCSATGTGSKRPDVLRRDENLGNLLQVQEKLAQHCADHILTPGGIMVYATCSILKQESEDQVEKLLARGNNGEGAVLETVPFTPEEIPGFGSAIDDNGWLRILPGMLSGNLGSCDGFFVARLKRLE